jgi:hypothetical protein
MFCFEGKTTASLNTVHIAETGRLICKKSRYDFEEMQVDTAHLSDKAHQRLALAKGVGMTKHYLFKVGELA